MGFALCASAADLTLQIQPRWRGAALAVPSAELKNDAGQALRLTRFAALLSGATLVREDGGRVQLEGQYGFINAEEGRLEWTLSHVPSGRYVGLEFLIGVPPAVNHADPARWAAGHALNPIVNGLHWSWQGGYVFAALEGRWRDVAQEDATAAANEVERGFSYHLATDARLMSVGFRALFEIADDRRVDLALDVARVLAKQTLAADDGSESTHSAEGDVLAPKLAAAFERAWFWLEAASAPARKAAPVAVAPRLTNDEGATPYAFTVPAGFPQPELPADNPLTVEGVALGRRLFFEPRLSATGTQSCASCHDPARAFSDTVALSRGADGSLGRRNAMPLFNLAWNPSFAWDGSQPRIRDQAHAAWVNPIEMHAEPPKVVHALAADASLAAGFAAAFGPREITPERVTLALEQFLITQVAADSKFDRALRGEAELSELEKRGFELFATEFDPARGRRGADCFHCHGGSLLSDFAPKNNGLDRESADAGRAAVTRRATDHGKFKTPSLRNVALTAPYMHDGRFATLEEVVAHYDHGVQRASALDANLAKHPTAGLQLTTEDQRALVTFLRALTDERLEVAPASSRYSSPSQ